LCDCGQTAPRPVFRPHIAGSTFEGVPNYPKSKHQFRWLGCCQLLFD
jgi:hypothetical protein